ncbi:uncharacterized protein [Palaemon carinicauda]|uniref:uncharacterized protein n=1 Tax=Palaemon carinicauda TaxID=392227 RepID=UPI0035B5BFAF
MRMTDSYKNVGFNGTHKGEHKHPAETALVRARKAVAEIKEGAVQSISNSVRNIILESVISLDENTHAQLPSIPVLSRTLHKHRKIIARIPTLPSTRHGFEIPESFRNLSDGENFLQFDSGSQDTNRILIFATDSGLSDLAKFPIWSCDGTFKSAPNQWTQLFCVHVQIGEGSFPQLNALLPDKTKTTYERLFSQLKILQPLLNPSELMVDFEIAIQRAFTSIFPNCSIVGCLFNLGQSLYWKITDLGLREKYNTESDFFLKVRCFSALAFIPVAGVEEAYEELTDDDEIPGEFISYFDVN